MPMLPIRVALGSVRLGLLETERVRVEAAAAGLVAEFASVTGELARELNVEKVAEMESVRAVRAMFRAWGLDPSKYRPASEALLRRVAQGKGLTHILNAVDIINLGSLETGWPYGGYDLDRIQPPVALRLGCAGEKYEGIGRRVWHLEGRPVLADREGAFGSPISDSTRTQVTTETRAVGAVIYAPVSAPERAVGEALARMAERLERWAGAEGARWEMLPLASS